MAEHTQEPGNAVTAQLVALLLQQSERTNHLIESLLQENKELRYVTYPSHSTCP